MSDLSPTVDRLISHGIRPSRALLARLADAAGAAALRAALRDATDELGAAHPALVRHRRRLLVLEASAAAGRREARETVIDTVRERRLSWGMRLAPTMVHGRGRPVYVQSTDHPTARATAGCVRRNLLPEHPDAIRAAIAVAALQDAGGPFAITSRVRRTRRGRRSRAAKLRRAHSE